MHLSSPFLLPSSSHRSIAVYSSRLLVLICATTHVMNLSPVVNLAREPRWGRNIETAGEDPYHLGQYAEAFVKGMQVYDDDPEHIMAGACCKHYVANS